MTKNFLSREWEKFPSEQGGTPLPLAFHHPSIRPLGDSSRSISLPGLIWGEMGEDKLSTGLKDLFGIFLFWGLIFTGCYISGLELFGNIVLPKSEYVSNIFWKSIHGQTSFLYIMVKHEEWATLTPHYTHAILNFFHSFTFIQHHLLNTLVQLPGTEFPQLFTWLPILKGLV